MSAFVETVNFSDLVDDALAGLFKMVERPQRLDLSTVLNPSDTTINLTASDVNVSTADTLEVGSEVMLVTEVQQPQPPVLTVSREYLGSPLSGQLAIGEPLLKNTPWPRFEVAKWVANCFRSVLNSELPRIETHEVDPETLNGEPGLLGLVRPRLVELPEDAMRVIQVRSQRSDGLIFDVPGWSFETRLPATISSTTVGLRLHPRGPLLANLWITYAAPYLNLSEGDELDLTPAARDLGPLWAQAYGITRRAVARSELDRVVEWNQEAALRSGVNLGLVRDLWGEFYRRLDEAKNVWRTKTPVTYSTVPRVRNTW